ncbi:SDR family oxidoreductase [Herbaspirillum seropedicae]|uniref:SDR family oxidoreductase n=1 Tax=Herbaspirillum seropedicae TaxID=964 RepID=UPI00285595CD|nr:SDR family oxidoreductase [Herbaspirillum seropedicae]MDR6396601.1 NAD(P)-dependent dehydrogenase (short-subunit alcohol dehydrogenase family) [Herbaspirillum seropedicae]
MKIADSTVLVTGANRGIGLAFTKAFLARGARKVYAAARDPSSITSPGVTPLKLDVTSPAEVEAAARMASDVSIVVNNAGIAAIGGFLAEDAEALLRRHFETNVFGVLRVSRAFAPALARNGGGALLNVASVGSWLSFPMLATYATSKAAVWSLSNGLRNELRGQGTQVMSLHMGFVDTDLTKDFDAQKSSPQEIVDYALDALEAGAEEALADELTRQVQGGLSAEHPIYLMQR